MQLLFISILVCQAPSAPSLILVSLHFFYFFSSFLSFFQNQRRLQVQRAQKDAEGEMMVWCSSKLWRWWPRLAVSGSFKHFGSELLWCIYITGPEPREATRLQLENKKEGLVAHLSATLCVHGDLELYRYHISSACLLVCLALQIIFKNFCNMFGFLKSLVTKCHFCHSSVQQ